MTNYNQLTLHQKKEVTEQDIHNLFSCLRRAKEGTPNYNKIVDEIKRRRADLQEYRKLIKEQEDNG